MTAPSLSIGLAGCGAWGKHILRDLRSLGCDVHVATRTQESATNALELGATSATTELDHLSGCTGVVVATPTSTHGDVIESLLPFGVPIFCEKPLAHDARIARALVERAGDRLFVMDKWRYHPGVLELARLARDGEIGAVQGLRTLRAQLGNPHLDVDCIWTLLPHDLSIALEILGAVPEPLSAVGYRSAGEVAGLIGQLRLGDGPWQTVEVSASAPEHRRRVELVCDDAVAVLADGWDEQVTVRRTSRAGATDVRTVEARGELPLLAELRAFVEHLAGGPAPRSSAAEGLRIVETITALRDLAGVDR